MHVEIQKEFDIVMANADDTGARSSSEIRKKKMHEKSNF